LVGSTHIQSPLSSKILGKANIYISFKILQLRTYYNSIALDTSNLIDLCKRLAR